MSARGPDGRYRKAEPEPERHASFWPAAVSLTLAAVVIIGAAVWWCR